MRHIDCFAIQHCLSTVARYAHAKTVKHWTSKNIDNLQSNWTDINAGKQILFLLLNLLYL